MTRKPWVVVIADCKVGPGAAGNLSKYTRVYIFNSEDAFQKWLRLQLNRSHPCKLTVYDGDPRSLGGVEGGDWDLAQHVIVFEDQE